MRKLVGVLLLPLLIALVALVIGSSEPVADADAPVVLSLDAEVPPAATAVHPHDCASCTHDIAAITGIDKECEAHVLKLPDFEVGHSDNELYESTTKDAKAAASKAWIGHGAAGVCPGCARCNDILKFEPAQVVPKNTA